MSGILRAGVIGAGVFGGYHAGQYARLAGVTLAGVYDPSAEAARALAERHGVAVFASEAELIAASDVVSVTSPAIAHAGSALAALRAGKAIYVEKPLATDLEAADAIVTEAARRGLVAACGFLERAGFAAMGLFDIPERPLRLEAVRLGTPSPRNLDVSVVLDLMIHDLDVVLAFVKSPVTGVEGVGIPVLSGSADIANARLRFANGCIANLTVSRISPERMRKIRVFSGPTHPCYISLDYRAQEGYIYRIARDGEAETPLLKKILAAKLGVGRDSAIVSEFGGKKIVREPVPIAKEEPLKRELQSFVDCVRARQTPVVSGESAKRALDLAFEITRQIEQQK